MQPILTCPDDQKLRHLAHDDAPAAEVEAFAEHLGECSSCAERLDALGVQTDLIAALGAGAAPPLPLDAGIEAAMVRLRKLASDPSAVSAGAYSTISTENTPVPLEDDPSSMLAPPQGPGEMGRVGTYRVLSVLGAGGMGMVFQAEDTTLRRQVALKVMRPVLAASTKARQRFLREAQSAAAVRHDHIVTIHQAGEAGGIAFLAMELLHGESLEHRLQREPRLPIAEALRIGREIAEGPAAAHERGLIHRDIKPSNIWLEKGRDRVKLLDFGLACSADGDANLTQSGAVVGTPAFMAPEQADGGKVDGRSDLFSLGCVLYRMVTGHPPFQGATHLQVLCAVALHQPEPAARLNAEVPRELSQLIDRLLAKQPHARPATAREIADALDRLAHVGNAASVAIRPRNRVMFGIGIAAALLLAFGGGGYTLYQIVIIRDRNGNEVARIQPAKDLKVEVIPDGKAADTKKPDIRPPMPEPLRRRTAVIGGLGRAPGQASRCDRLDDRDDGPPGRPHREHTVQSGRPVARDSRPSGNPNLEYSDVEVGPIAPYNQRLPRQLVSG